MIGSTGSAPRSCSGGRRPTLHKRLARSTRGNTRLRGTSVGRPIAKRFGSGPSRCTPPRANHGDSRSGAVRHGSQYRVQPRRFHAQRAHSSNAWAPTQCLCAEAVQAFVKLASDRPWCFVLGPPSLRQIVHLLRAGDAHHIDPVSLSNWNSTLTFSDVMAGSIARRPSAGLAAVLVSAPSSVPPLQRSLFDPTWEPAPG